MTLNLRALAQQPLAFAEPDRLQTLCRVPTGGLALRQYDLLPGATLADVDRDGFWDKVVLFPGDVIFVRARLPDGSTAVLMRAVAEVEPAVRVRRVR